MLPRLARNEKPDDQASDTPGRDAPQYLVAPRYQ